MDGFFPIRKSRPRGGRKPGSLRSPLAGGNRREAHCQSVQFDLVKNASRWPVGTCGNPAQKILDICMYVYIMGLIGHVHVNIGLSEHRGAVTMDGMQCNALVRGRETDAKPDATWPSLGFLSRAGTFTTPRRNRPKW